MNMKRGTLVAALIVVSTPVSRISSGEPLQPATAAPVKNGAMAELDSKLSFDTLPPQSGFINVKFFMPAGFVPCFKHVCASLKCRFRHSGAGRVQARTGAADSWGFTKRFCF